MRACEETAAGLVGVEMDVTCGGASVSPFPATPEARRSGRLVASLALCVFVTTAGGGLTSIDAVMTYEVTKNLVSHGSVAASYNVFGWEPHRGIDQRFYSPFGVGQSIFNIPFYVAGRVARDWFGIRVGRPETIEKSAVALGSAVASAGIVWVGFLFAWRLGGNLSGATWTALTLGFGTLVWPYSKFGFNTALTTCCLLAGVYGVWLGVRSGRRWPLAWGGVWLACAFLTRHEMALAAPIAGAWVAFESRTNQRVLATRLVWLGAPLAAALAFWLWYNFVRFGNPLNTGNMGDPVVGFDAPILVGLHGLLVSPGRSLFVYAPVTIAGVAALVLWARCDRSTAALFAALFVSFTLVYASLPYWEGSRGYGPRYLVPLVPFLVIPLVWWLTPGSGRWQRVLVGLAALSMIVQLPGVLVDFSKVVVAHARNVGGFSREAGLYTWRESGLVLNARAALAAVPENAGYLMRGIRPPAATQPPGEIDRDLSQRFDFSLDFWWLYLYYLGAIPAPIAVAAGAAPLVAGWVVIRRLSHLLRSTPMRAQEHPAGTGDA